MSARGLLLVNLGTPDAPTPSAVRRYLRQFLMDPRVVDLPAIPRALLVHAVILPVRPQRSAAAYRKVWMDEGSPLLVHSRAFEKALQARLSGTYEVALGMRYGNPSIDAALSALRARGVTELSVLPLYPQYATSSTGSSVAEVFKEVGRLWDPLPLRILPPFFDQPGFLEAFAKHAQASIAASAPEHVLFSFHGLPERQIRKSDVQGTHCLSHPTCCDHPGASLSFCYRAQCVATARGLAARLSLSPDRYTICFQSRLGRTPWITPHTDKVLDELGARGIKRLLVVCPSFVADCLETVEEIAIRAKAQFLAAGGEALTLVPSLNADPEWVDAVARMVT